MSNVLPKLLVLGGPDSGKSTFRAQIYQRVEHQEGELRLVNSVGDMAGLDGDVNRLVQGLQPMHTHLDTYHSTTLLVENRAGYQFTLEFADYGGEQIRRIGESNAVPATWVERARQSSSWLFFLRIDQIRSTKSFMTEPVHTELKTQPGDDTQHQDQSAEINAVEALQRLLFVRGTSLRHQLHSPRLGVLLSCWDELADEERLLKPGLVLAERAPLFSRFVTSNWEPNRLKVWGVSPTGRKLPEKEPDEAFARKGPEHAGYIVLEEGSLSPDLTLPINWLMQTA